MKRLILIGRAGCGKTTLTQKLQNNIIQYKKTQYVNYYDTIIDTPGEYAETKGLGAALALYSYEADIVGLVISAVEEYSLFPPNITCMVNRETVGIVTKADANGAEAAKAASWLALCGCEKIFYVSAKTGEGIEELLEYLK